MQNDNTIKGNEDAAAACPNNFNVCDGMQFLQNSTEILKKHFQILEHLLKNKDGAGKIEKIFDHSKVSLHF